MDKKWSRKVDRVIIGSVFLVEVWLDRIWHQSSTVYVIYALSGSCLSLDQYYYWLPVELISTLPLSAGHRVQVCLHIV